MIAGCCSACPSRLSLQAIAQLVPNFWLETQHQLARAFAEVHKALSPLRWANLLCSSHQGPDVQ